MAKEQRQLTKNDAWRGRADNETVRRRRFGGIKKCLAVGSSILIILAAVAFWTVNWFQMTHPFVPVDYKVEAVANIVVEEEPTAGQTPANAEAAAANDSGGSVHSNEAGDAGGVTRVTPKGYIIATIDGITYVDGTLIANKSYALPPTYNPGGLTPETYNAFLEMRAAAATEGLDIYIVSGLRTYDTQSVLYNNYVARDGQLAADTYSARPGHSEHQTGLAFDLNSVSDDFGLSPEGQWLNTHAAEYGFILRYPQGKTHETGYMYESWHFRYVGRPLAAILYNNGDWITLENYYGLTSVYSY